MAKFKADDRVKVNGLCGSEYEGRVGTVLGAASRMTVGFSATGDLTPSKFPYEVQFDGDPIEGRKSVPEDCLDLLDESLASN